MGGESTVDMMVDTVESMFMMVTTLDMMVADIMIMMVVDTMDMTVDTVEIMMVMVGTVLSPKETVNIMILSLSPVNVDELESGKMMQGSDNVWWGA